MDKEENLMTRRCRILFSIMVALGLFLRLPNFNRSLWYDEICYSSCFMLGSFEKLIKQIQFDFSAPLHHVFMFFWMGLFGDSEISVRIPSLVFGLLSIILTYWLASRYIDVSTAILATFLLCMSPVHIWYSQEATPYSMSLFLFLLLIFSFHKLQENSGRVIWHCIYFIVLFLFSFSHWFFTTYLLLFTVLCLMRFKIYKFRILILNGVVLAAVSLFLVWKGIFGHQDVEQHFLRPFSFFECWSLFFNWFLSGNSIWSSFPNGMRPELLWHSPLQLLTHGIFFIILLWGIVLLLRPGHPSSGWMMVLILFFLPGVALFLSYAWHKHIYIERYLFIILPFFYMVLSKGVTGIKNTVLKAVVIAMVIVFSSVATVEFFMKTDLRTVYKQNPDWRSATEYFMNEQERLGKPLVIMVSPLKMELFYYRDQFFKKKNILLRFSLEERYEFARIDKALEDTNPKVFYLVCNDTWHGMAEAILGRIAADPRVKILSRNVFVGLKIYKCEIF